VDWLKCEFMLDRVGEEFDGVVANVTGFGFFAELKDIFVEGLVHISTLPNDYYQFDATKQALLGERSGRRFRLGDVVRIRVARVDLDQRQIDFMLAEVLQAEPKQPRPKKKKSGKKKRS
jgi:ribonuclease R